MKIAWIDFVEKLREISPNTRVQVIAPAPEVHVYDVSALQEEFWPVWGQIRKEIDRKVANRPMTNSAKKRNCEAINKRLTAELLLAVAQTYDDDVSLGGVEASVFIPAGYTLNYVTDGAHRTFIIAVTHDGGKTWELVLIESQLYYENYKITSLADAVAGGVTVVECWL